jgi:hypothetical protein
MRPPKHSSPSRHASRKPTNSPVNVQEAARKKEKRCAMRSQPRNVTERFGAAGVLAARINCEKQTYTFRFDGEPSGFVDLFRRYYGPTMNAFEAAEKNGRSDALRLELEELFATQNRSGREDVTTIPASFLLVTADVN